MITWEVKRVKQSAKQGTTKAKKNTKGVEFKNDVLRKGENIIFGGGGGG